MKRLYINSNYLPDAKCKHYLVELHLLIDLLLSERNGVVQE